MVWCSQHSLWFFAVSFLLQFFLPQQNFSDVYTFLILQLSLVLCHLKSGNVFDEYWFPGWLSNGLHHCACIQPLFLRFLIVLFLCSVYQKPNTLLKYQIHTPKYQIQSVSINLRATTVIPILNCPLRSIYLSIPILLFCRLLNIPKSNNRCFPNLYCSQSSSSYLSTDSVNNTRRMLRQGQFSFIFLAPQVL